jgi:amidohydrolase
LKRAAFVLFAVASTAALAQSPDFRAEAQKMRPKLVEIRRDLHMHPELSNREERTSKKIAEHLRLIGVPFETGIAKYGVVATIKGGKAGKSVAVRVDIDALPILERNEVPYKSLNPGVKHACGHDLHTTVGLATAEMLWKRRADLPGTVHVIFQPAEEGPPAGEEGGAPLMIKEGLLDRLKPAAMFGIHSMPTVRVGDLTYTPGPQLASSDSFKITITGRGSHGAEPHRSIDPIVIGAQTILALQAIDSRRIDPLEPIVVTIGQFHGGTRFNVIPEKVEMEGTLRTLSPRVREDAKRLITEISEGTARTAGGTAVVEFDPSSNPPLLNDIALSEFGEQSFVRHFGREHVRRDPPRMVAEDFAHFAELVPSFYFFVGVGNPEKRITGNLHTADFDIDEDALVVGSAAMTHVVWDYLTR